MSHQSHPHNVWPLPLQRLLPCRLWAWSHSRSPRLQDMLFFHAKLEGCSVLLRFRRKFRAALAAKLYSQSSLLSSCLVTVWTVWFVDVFVRHHIPGTKSFQVSKLRARLCPYLLIVAWIYERPQPASLLQGLHFLSGLLLLDFNYTKLMLVVVLMLQDHSSVYEGFFFKIKTGQLI